MSLRPGSKHLVCLSSVFFDVHKDGHPLSESVEKDKQESAVEE
jgi:hypothetical protein